MRPAAPRCFALLALVLLAVLAAACGSGSETTVQATLVPPVEVTNGPGATATTPPTYVFRPGSAPCTAEALLDAMAASDSTVVAVGTYACDQQWAYAESSNGRRFLLEANGPRWSVVDPGSVCPTATIPTPVRSAACSRA